MPHAGNDAGNTEESATPHASRWGKVACFRTPAAVPNAVLAAPPQRRSVESRAETADASTSAAAGRTLTIHLDTSDDNER